MAFTSGFRTAAKLHVLHFSMGGGDSSYFSLFVGDERVHTAPKLAAYLAQHLCWYFSQIGEWSALTRVAVERGDPNKPRTAADARDELDPDSEMYAMSLGVVEGGRAPP
jgi:hypothetical protein